jgi:hypothetical protein
LKPIFESSKHKKIRLLAQDESRFGLMTVKRRKITLKGVKPEGLYNTDRENFWIYGATDVNTGKSLFWEFNSLSKANFSFFVDQVSKEYSDSLNIMLIDNSKTHFLDNYPDNVVFINTEPYSPELNPEERVWGYFKESLGYKVFDEIDSLRAFVYDKIKNTPRKIFKSLTSYSYILEPLHALYQI